MATTITRQQRQATPARWQKAVERAIAENVQVRQLAGSGAWIATSGSDTSAAYELEITGTVAHGCTCLAGINGDPVCKHRASFYVAIGLLDPEPDPPASVLVACAGCAGTGSRHLRVVSPMVAGGVVPIRCGQCRGAGVVEPEVPALAA